MSKNKKTESVEEVVLSADPVYDHIVDTYGPGVLRTGQDIIDNPPEIVSVSPSLDIILGGGIPLGSFVIFTGPPKVGKSTIALHFAGNAQKHGCKIYYINVESRLKSRDVCGIKTLDTSLMSIVGSTPGKILNAEDYLNIVTEIILNEKRAVVILDSVSQLCSGKEFASTIGERERDPIHLHLSTLTKKISNVLPINNCILICITHQIANTSGGQAKWSESGGNKIKYATDVKLHAKYCTKWCASSNPEDEPIGQIIHCETTSTAICAPGRKIDAYLRYGVGLDETSELIALGIKVGLIKKGGVWYSYGDTLKACGQEKLWQAFEADKTLLESLRTSIKEILG